MKYMVQLKNLIKNLSKTTELLIVLFIGFGLMIYSSTRSFFYVNSDYSHSLTYKFTSFGNYYIIIYEIVALALIVYVLMIRDWTTKDFNLEFTFRLIWIALLLHIIINITGGLGFNIFKLFNVVDNKVITHVQFESAANWISIALIIVVNSIYEEFILIGYLFKRLEKFHPVLIVGFSLIIRELYHTYQGWMSLFTIVPLGLVFGYFYYKYKKLWPLVMAHGFHNLIAFLSMNFHWHELLKK